MNFTPRSEQECERLKSNLLVKGEYDFEIVSAVDKVSTAGNEMIELRVKIFDSFGQPVNQIFDYLLNTDRMAYKLRHCCRACGLLSEYESKRLDSSQFVGHTGKCLIDVQKDKSGSFPDRNVITDYTSEKDELPFH
jgi:hypothetical protein